MLKEGMKKVKPFGKPYNKLIRLSVVLSLVYSITSILIGYLIKVLVDNALIPKENSVLLKFILWYGIVIILFMFSYLAKNYLFIYIEENIANNLRVKAYKSTLNSPINFFINENNGVVNNIILNDINNIKEFSTSIIIELFNSLLMIAIVFTVLAFTDFRIALIIIPAPIIFSMIIMVFGQKMYGLSTKLQQEQSSIISIVEEAYSSINTVKTLLLEKYFKSKLSTVLTSVSKNRIKLSKNMSIMNSAWNIIITPYEAIILGIGGYLYLTKGSPSIGMILAILSFIAILIGPTMTILSSIGSISNSISSLNRITNYISRETERYDGKDLEENFKGTIEFENVNFSYDKENSVINNISFSINENEKVAIVGESGGGKSTIGNLIMRHYTTATGKITIDHTDVNEIALDSLRKSVAIVDQQPYFFMGTILENLKIGNMSTSLDNIMNICKSVEIHDFIVSQPQGYDTMLRDGGENLSGGQKQRLAIARAIIKDSKIVIFDEITSALDSKTEKTILEAIKKYLKNKTVIMITHRLYNIEDYDKILVIDKGVLKEEGTHQSLLGKKHIYYELYNLFLKGKIAN
jgi:ABC-type multidrug transport system fused ATPase/permease subunit